MPWPQGSIQQALSSLRTFFSSGDDGSSRAYSRLRQWNEKETEKDVPQKRESTHDKAFAGSLLSGGKTKKTHPFANLPFSSSLLFYLPSLQKKKKDAEPDVVLVPPIFERDFRGRSRMAKSGLPLPVRPPGAEVALPRLPPRERRRLGARRPAPGRGPAHGHEAQGRRGGRGRVRPGGRRDAAVPALGREPALFLRHQGWEWRKGGGGDVFAGGGLRHRCCRSCSLRVPTTRPAPRCARATSTPRGGLAPLPPSCSLPEEEGEEQGRRQEQRQERLPRLRRLRCATPLSERASRRSAPRSASSSTPPPGAHCARPGPSRGPAR